MVRAACTIADVSLLCIRTRYERMVRERRWKALKIGPDSSQYDGSIAHWSPSSAHPSIRKPASRRQALKREQREIAATVAQQHQQQSNELCSGAVDGAQTSKAQGQEVEGKALGDVEPVDDLKIDLVQHSPGTEWQDVVLGASSRSPRRNKALLSSWQQVFQDIRHKRVEDLHAVLGDLCLEGVKPPLHTRPPATDVSTSGDSSQLKGPPAQRVAGNQGPRYDAHAAASADEPGTLSVVAQLEEIQETQRILSPTLAPPLSPPLAHRPPLHTPRLKPRTSPRERVRSRSRGGLGTDVSDGGSDAEARCNGHHNLAVSPADQASWSALVGGGGRAVMRGGGVWVLEDETHTAVWRDDGPRGAEGNGGEGEGEEAGAGSVLGAATDGNELGGRGGDSNSIGAAESEASCAGGEGKTERHRGRHDVYYLNSASRGSRSAREGAAREGAAKARGGGDGLPNVGSASPELPPGPATARDRMARQAAAVGALEGEGLAVAKAAFPVRFYKTNPQVEAPYGPGVTTPAQLAGDVGPWTPDADNSRLTHSPPARVRRGGGARPATSGIRVQVIAQSEELCGWPSLAARGREEVVPFI